MKLLLITWLLILSTDSWCHGGKDHSKRVNNVVIAKPNDELKKKYTQINERYIKMVKPIFKKSCFDCHGDTTKYPWYYKIPLVKQLIDHDIKESKEHLDFSQDFPFASHETPFEDLKAIDKTVKEGSMPPLRYRIMHRNSKLTEDEVKQVEQWVIESKEILN